MQSRLSTARDRMLRRLYDRIIALSSHPHALAWLALLAVAESSVFPLAPDILIIPMAIARPRRAWLIAGYAIGHFLFKAIGQPIVDFYGLQPLLEEFRRLYRRWGVLIIAAGGFTPIPYKVIAIASGIAGLDPLIFILASTASRGSRFFLEAALLSRYGEPLRRFIASHLVIFATLVLLLLLGALLLLRYL